MPISITGRCESSEEEEQPEEIEEVDPDPNDAHRRKVYPFTSSKGYFRICIGIIPEI